MGTRYEEVYERYRGQVRNYEFLDRDFGSYKFA